MSDNLIPTLVRFRDERDKPISIADYEMHHTHDGSIMFTSRKDPAEVFVVPMSNVRRIEMKPAVAVDEVLAPSGNAAEAAAKRWLEEGGHPDPELDDAQAVALEFHDERDVRNLSPTPGQTWEECETQDAERAKDETKPVQKPAKRVKRGRRSKRK